MPSLSRDRLRDFNQSQRYFIKPLESDLIRSGYVSQSGRQTDSQSTVCKCIQHCWWMFTLPSSSCTINIRPNIRRSEKNDKKPSIVSFSPNGTRDTTAVPTPIQSPQSVTFESSNRDKDTSNLALGNIERRMFHHQYKVPKVLCPGLRITGYWLKVDLYMYK